jgi:hypothetical protein
MAIDGEQTAVLMRGDVVAVGMGGDWNDDKICDGLSLCLHRERGAARDVVSP